MKGLPTSKKENRGQDLAALTAEYARWRKRLRQEGGGGVGGEKKSGKESKDVLLKESVQDFENWKRLREGEEVERVGK